MRDAYIKSLIVVFVLVAGVGGAIVTSETAYAEIQDFNIAGTSATIGDGQIPDAQVNLSGSWGFDGLDENSTSVIVTLEAKNPDGTWSTLDTYRQATNGEKSATGTYSMANVSLLDNSKWTRGDISSMKDGATTNTTIETRLTIAVNGTDTTLVETSKHTSFTISVTNVGASVRGSGNGAAYIPDSK